MPATTSGTFTTVVSQTATVVTFQPIVTAPSFVAVGGAGVSGKFSVVDTNGVQSDGATGFNNVLRVKGGIVTQISNLNFLAIN